jgi:hypothetical protein
MASVAVSIGDLEAGNLPALCAKTGAPTANWTRMRLAATPGWTWILILFGIVPYFLASYFATVRVAARVPLQPSVARRLHRLLVAQRMALVGGIAVLLVGSFTGTVALGVIGLAGLVGGIALTLMGYRGSVGARPGPTPGSLVLTGVHPAFAGAVAATPRQV